MLARLDKYEYSGPGWVDWLASFGATILLALEINSRGTRDLVQSGVSYYFMEPGVQTIHIVSVSMNIAFLLCAMVWLITRFHKSAERAMVVLALAAVALCWFELSYALNLQEGAVFRLPELPFRPINNLGIVGAQLFGSYLIFKLPQKNLKAISALLIKSGLCICLWAFQAVLWQALFVPR